MAVSGQVRTKPAQRWAASPICRVSDTHGENVRPTALTTSECTSLNVASVSKGIRPLIWRVRGLLINFQNLLFRCMPAKSFYNMGLSKSDTIKLSHSMRSLDFTSQLSKITCPVTVLCGEKDRANLKASIKLNELLPQAALHIIPGAGHEVNKYAPETISAILNGQLAKIQR